MVKHSLFLFTLHTLYHRMITLKSEGILSMLRFSMMKFLEDFLRLCESSMGFLFISHINTLEDTSRRYYYIVSTIFSKSNAGLI